VGLPEQTCFEQHENQGYVGPFNQEKVTTVWDAIKYGGVQILEVAETKTTRGAARQLLIITNN
jgi:hypothetical protein